MFNENEGPFRIYVSGFGPYTNYSVIVNYFSPFGKVEIDQTLTEFIGTKKDERRSSIEKQIKYQDKCITKKGKNYVILVCDNLITYDRILGAKSLYYQRSQVVCNPYKTGLQLIIHNQKLNQRRAILRKVPFQVSKEDLIQTLNVLVGNVESVYVFPSRNRESQGKHYSISVSFTKKRSLENLLLHAQQGIYILGEQISVERYCSNSGIKGTPAWNSQAPTATAIADSQNYMKHKGESMASNLQISKTPNNQGSIQICNPKIKPCSRTYHLHSSKGFSNNHSTENLRYNLIPGRVSSTSNYNQ